MTGTLDHSGAAEARWVEPRVFRWLGWLLFCAVVAYAAWWRWQIRAPAVSSDEIALVNPPSRCEIGFFANIEWARNSPLFPLLFACVPDLNFALRSGRDLATLCGFAAIVAIFFAARRATGGDTLSGALAAALVGFNPILAYESVTFRPYGIWALVESWRLVCLFGLLADARRTPRPRLWKAFVVLTCLMPWTHYASFVILAFEGLLFAVLLPGKRWLLRAHAIAAAAALPLIAFVVYMRNSPDSAGGSFDRALSIAFARHFEVAGWPWVAGLFVLALFLSRPLAARAAIVHWLAMGLSALLLSATTLVRPAVAALGVPAFAVAVPTVISVYFGRARYLGLAAAALLVFMNWPFAPIRHRYEYGPAHESPDIVAFAADLRRETESGQWSVFPDWDLTVLNFNLETSGSHVESVGPDSLQMGPIRLQPFRDLTKPPPGRVVVFSCDAQLKGCTPTGGRPCAKTYECP